MFVTWLGFPAAVQQELPAPEREIAAGAAAVLRFVLQLLWLCCGAGGPSGHASRAFRRETRPAFYCCTSSASVAPPSPTGSKVIQLFCLFNRR